MSLLTMQRCAEARVWRMGIWRNDMDNSPIRFLQGYFPLDLSVKVILSFATWQR